ncbi:putative ribonuclease H-like domain-containing protein [Tanacetum coccineum]|uniref:Ribonuclease H-like domain-containing protein n=1 Tax=Tanacetum coccineum TaxID=301880 RepID=A0ABQ4YSH2_9ASTR
MQDELLQFKLQKVWTLVDLPYGKRAIGTKWVYVNKKDERGIVIRNKERLVIQGYTHEEGIDYDEVFAPVARIEAIKLFLAYASFKDFVVYQMDVKSAFLYGKIKEEVYVCQTPGFEDPEFPGELTFFLGLQVTQKDDGIFISQDKYVDEILKKFDFLTVKTASTPIETSNPLLKDAEAKDVDVHLYRSMIGSLMYLIALRPDIIYLKGQPKLGLWYPKDSPFDLEAYTDSDYIGASLDRKSTTGGCQFLRSRLILWQCKKQTIVAKSTTEAEYVAASSCCGQVLWIQNQMLDYGYNFMNTKIFIDNESTICIVKNPMFHSKTKHIEIRHHFIRDSYEKRLIQVIKIHTDHNVADLLTKALDIDDWNGLDILLAIKFGFILVTQELVLLSSEPTTLIVDETVHKDRGDSVERAATTATTLDAEQGSGNINRTQSMAIPNDPFPQRISSGGSLRRQDTMRDRPAQTRFERLSKQSNEPPLSRVNTLGSREDSMNYGIDDLFKKLESKKKSRTPQLKRRLFKVRIESSAEKSLGDPEDASKQGRNEINQDEGISWFQEDSETQGSSIQFTTVGVSISTAKPSTPPTTTTTTPIEDEDLTIAQTLMKMKSEKSKAKGVTMQEPSESGTRVRVPPPQIDPKDKGKAKMVEPEKPKKKKDQIEYDADVAQRLQAELDEEARLEREREEEASKTANIAEWDDVQAMMDADYELAAKLQAEEQGEISIEERSKLFVELMNERKKHFARLRAEEQRRKPLTKAQKRNQMSNYLKNMAGYTLQQLRGYSFDEIKTLFETSMRRVNTFVPIESEVDRAVPELAVGSSKRAKEEELCIKKVLQGKRLVKLKLAKKPRDKEVMNLLGDHQVGNHTEVHHSLMAMLKAFAIGRLSVMLGSEKGIDIYMLVEKEYPLSRGTLSLMLVINLLVDQDNEMSRELLRKIFMHAERPRR